MITVSVTPQRVVVGRSAQLEIRLSNNGGGSCANVVFTLGLPAGLRLVSGRERIGPVPIRPGVDSVHTVTVQAERAGDYTLTSANFSYRDEDDRSVRVSDWHVSVTAEAARPVPAAVARPAPRLRIEQEDGELATGEWGLLPIRVRNESDVQVSDVSVSVAGPIETNGKSGRIVELRQGQTARIPFSVKPASGGLVPVSVRLVFRYPDGLGSLRQCDREEQLNVQVGRQGAVREEKPVRTVLFLAASPQNLAPIRPDLELRKIEQELRLDQNRDAFLLASHVAARLDDISRALIRHRPDVVHLSGHGNAEGALYVEDEYGFAEPTNVEGMAQLFGRHKATLRCVVVNACNSDQLANAMSRQIDHAVGMRSDVEDSVSVKFSVGFYQAFFGGETVPDAFESGCSLLRASAETAPYYQVPVLYPGGPA